MIKGSKSYLFSPALNRFNFALGRGVTKPVRWRLMMVKGTAGTLSGKWLEPNLMGKSIRRNF